MLGSLQNGKASFISHHPMCSCSLSTAPTNNPFLYCNQFSLPFINSQPFFFQHTIPASPTNAPFLYTTAIVLLLIFTYSHPYDSTKNTFLTSTIQPIPRPTEQVSLVWSDTCFNVSLITTLTILISYGSFLVDFCIAGISF